MSIIGRGVAATGQRISEARRRWGWFDHLWRALDRYGEVLGGRLAAAIAYYGFFAVFALGLVAYWIFGAALGGGGGDRLSVATAAFLRRNLPFLDPAQIEQSSGKVGVVGLILLALTGIGWVEAIRSSQRIMYGLNQQPGNFVVRRFVDLAVLIGVFMLLGLSVSAVDALEALLSRLFGARSAVSAVSSWLLAVPVNMVLALALLAALPRLHMTARRLWPSVLLVSVGITLLNTVGLLYVGRTEHNPAYAVVRGAVSLLLYLYLLNQLLLLGAALAATSRHGRVVDLSAGRPPRSGT